MRLHFFNKFLFFLKKTKIIIKKLPKFYFRSFNDYYFIVKQLFYFLQKLQPFQLPLIIEKECIDPQEKD